MTVFVLMRSTVLIVVLGLLLGSCRKAEPIVDLSPLGDAVRFLAVAFVLGVIIQGVLKLWERD
jgi:hypothetical protein